MSILKPAGYHALGNMPAINSPLQSTKAVVYFMPTPIMSTYLVAFILCDFANKESTTREGVKVRVWGPAAAVADGQADFALSVATETISYYGSLFNIPYPLPKVRLFDGDRNSHNSPPNSLLAGHQADLVAIPDFAAGAMENFGFVDGGEGAQAECSEH